MDSAARRVLKVCKEDIKRNLLVNEDILDMLEEDDILTEEMAQSVKAERTPNEKINKLLFILPRRGPNAFQVFINAIRKDFEFLADRLLSQYAEESKVRKPADQQTSSSEKTESTSTHSDTSPNDCFDTNNNNTTIKDTAESSKSCVTNKGTSDTTYCTIPRTIPTKVPTFGDSNGTSEPVVTAKVASNTTDAITTGAIPPQVIGAIPPQVTGAIPPQVTGAIPPQVTGAIPPQVTGAIPPQVTGYQAAQSMQHKLFDMNDTIQSSKSDNSMGQGHPEFQQNLNSLYTKLKTHLTNKNMRELSFNSPEPVTFQMIHNLLDELLKMEEKCFRVLGAKDRSASLLTHLIDLTMSRKDLRNGLKETDEQRNKYAEKIIKLENTIRQKTETKEKLAKEYKKLKVVMEVTREENEKMTELLQQASEELDERDETNATIRHRLEEAEHKVEELQQKVADSSAENHRLETECSKYKQKCEKYQQKEANQNRVKPKYAMHQSHATDSRSSTKEKLQLSIGTKRLCNSTTTQETGKTSHEKKELKFDEGTDMTDEEKQKALNDHFATIQNCSRNDALKETEVSSIRKSNNYNSNTNAKFTARSTVLESLGINISSRREVHGTNNSPRREVHGTTVSSKVGTTTKMEAIAKSSRKAPLKTINYGMQKQTKYHHIK